MSSLVKQTIRVWPQALRQTSAACFSTSAVRGSVQDKDNLVVEIKEKKPKSERFAAFQKKLRAKTPLGKLDELSRHPYQEQEPLKPWPNSVNPYTGEVGGPAGPEPTRYGDWERKGRVSDF